MLEDVRMVIWDLDETFWRGTLSEGGVEYVDAHHDIVRALNRRGIVNSICSRNDPEPVEQMLRERALWDEFIFPSIDWAPKAERVREIIDAAQLRPASVLFIDDNPGVRAQVSERIPELQVSDETVISTLLDNPALRGKPDEGLSRLRQYKVLEEKQGQLRKAGGDTAEFLRDSAIQVEIIPAVEDHFPRAIELINRTNQLNFTKARLPEDFDEAVAKLKSQMDHYFVRAGLVSVRDKYGDYGVCGFFLAAGIAAWGKPELQHFAFSCRVLGMGVEQHVYRLLGEPAIRIVGEVLSDLHQPVDWINTAVAGGPAADADDRIPEVRLRGGCELEVIEHYLKAHAASVNAELIEPRGICYLPRQNSIVLAQSVAPLDFGQADLLRRAGLGHGAGLATRVFDPAPEGALIIYSPTGDAMLPVRRHRANGLTTVAWFQESALPENADRSAADAERYDAAMAVLDAAFDTLPVGHESIYRECYAQILDAVPAEALMIVLLPNERYGSGENPVTHAVQQALNVVFREVGAGRPNVVFINMTDLISIDEVTDHYLHFDRAVYYRLFRELLEVHRRWRSAPERRSRA